MSRAHAALVAVALVVACGGDAGNQGDPDPRTGPLCPTSLQEVASQIFEVSCVDAGCHGSNDRAAGLDLETGALELELYGREAALCDGEVRVVPGDAASSHLIDKLRGTGCGAQMPVGAPLPEETIDCMATWIDGLDPTACETCGTGNLCIDLATDPAHCGVCGNACPATSTCVDGICACPRNRSICAGSCVDLMSDPANCGACQTDCGDLFCLEGSCSSDCGDLTECSGACVDLMSDSANCGSCGGLCGTGTSCAGGQCQCGATTVSLAGDVQPIFTASCISAGCHDGSSGPGGGPGSPGGGATSLDLTVGNALQSLLDTTTRCGDVLVPGDPGASILIGKLDGTELCMGSQMPKGSGPLTPAEIDLIATWVCQGAENN